MQSEKCSAVTVLLLKIYFQKYLDTMKMNIQHYSVGYITVCYIAWIDDKGMSKQGDLVG